MAREGSPSAAGRARRSRRPSDSRTARNAGTPCRCRARAPRTDRPARSFAHPAQFAAARLDEAIHHLHQRRLAGAVLAEQRVDFGRIRSRSMLSLARKSPYRLLMETALNSGSDRPETGLWRWIKHGKRCAYPVFSSFLQSFEGLQGSFHIGRRPALHAGIIRQNRPACKRRQIGKSAQKDATAQLA